MPTVFRREGSKTFHRHQDCVQLQKAPARGNPSPLVAVDLRDVPRPRPCLTCYPDAPRAKAVRRHCSICNRRKTMPCPHNGGVLVTTAYKTGYVGLLRDPGDEVVRQFWVWPEQAHFYEPVAS